MTSSPLHNYLRTHRKRLALAQDEVAFLLGIQSGAKVCRHELYVSEPNLETALAYEVIFQRPARELFAGLYQRIEQDVVARAKTLAYRTGRQQPDHQTTKKLRSLGSITAKSTDSGTKS